MLKPSASSKGSKNSARTAFSVAQDVERSLGSPRMLHGHLHQLLHASSIMQLHVESPGFFTKCYHIDRGNLLQYKLIYSSRMYIVLKKVPGTGIPCIKGNSNGQAASCICESLNRAGMPV